MAPPVTLSETARTNRRRSASAPTRPAVLFGGRRLQFLAMRFSDASCTASRWCCSGAHERRSPDGAAGCGEELRPHDRSCGHAMGRGSRSAPLPTA
jgi:hypothetical protein